jgi:phosphoribosylformimino-5-aminoimidazole carboxamide ribotide isomerase
MQIIPAIDIKDGKCVRLYKGIKERVTVYSDNPSEIAERWEDMGALSLHVVDLDGAFTGIPQNEDIIKNILRSVKIPIQLGGGIRDMSTIDNYIRLGVHRIVLGTSAYKNPDIVVEACNKYKNRIILGIDARDGFVAIEGWENSTFERASEMAKKFERLGIYAIIYTDINRDGTMSGPNIEAIKKIKNSVYTPIIASGGISSLEDIKRLIPLNIMGVIIGKALYDGRIDLKESLCLQRE